MSSREGFFSGRGARSSLPGKIDIFSVIGMLYWYRGDHGTRVGKENATNLHLEKKEKKKTELSLKLIEIFTVDAAVDSVWWLS